MRIKTAAAYLVTARLGYECLSETGNQRTDQHDRPAQLRAALQEIIAFQVSQIHEIGLERIGFNIRLRYLYSHIAEQLNQIVHIQNIGDIADSHLFRSQ